MSLGCPNNGYQTVFTRVQFLGRPGRREATFGHSVVVKARTATEVFTPMASLIGRYR